MLNRGNFLHILNYAYKTKRSTCLYGFYLSTSTTSIKHECKNTIVQRLSALELKNYINKRFGHRQLESKILESTEGKNFLYTISYFYTYSPEYSKGTSIVDYTLSNLNSLAISENDPKISWLRQRILQPTTEDAVPKPHYPSILLNYTMQWPFQPSELDNYRDITSMYKFPYFKPTVDIIPEKSERFNPETHENRVKNLACGASDRPDNSQTDIKMPYKTVATQNDNLSSDSYIYSPTEMEVIQSDYLFNFDKIRHRR